MIRTPTSSIGLLLLLLLTGFTAADVNTARFRSQTSLGPEPDLQPRTVRSSVCQEHTSLHNRLDVVEKKVEDTVENLEVELAALLESIQDPEWRPLLENVGKTVDILEEPEKGPVLN